MPSFSLRKLRSRSNSQQRLKNDDDGGSSGGGGKRTNNSSPKSTSKSSPTSSTSKQRPQAATAAISPEGLKFLGSKQGPNNYPTYDMSSGATAPPPNKRIGRQISNGSADSMAYSSNASEASDGVFITAFDRCPPTFSDDVLDRGIFPTPSADIIVGGGSYSRTWEADHDLAVLEEMTNEWTMFSDPSFENRNPMTVTKNMGALQRDDPKNHHHQNVMDNSFGAMPKEKIARLVSPDRNTTPGHTSTAAASAAVTPAHNDDLSAWGLTSTATTTTMDNRESQTTNRATTATHETDNLQDAFGSNFFSSGFDDDDGFFGQSDWAEVSSSKSPTNDNMSGAVGGDVKANYPWGQTQGGINPFEEKKDEDTGSVVFTNVSLPDPITPTTEPTFSHPLKQQQLQQHQTKTNKEVVVSFEDYNHEIMHSPSNSSFSSRPTTVERNTSYERSSRPPVTTSKSHRRINSNGSGSRRRGGKSGGSVGSNSSAVDQILEHYRQKRLAKHHGGKTSSAASSTVSSQPSSSNHRSIPSFDSISSAPSSDMAAAAAAAAPAAAALSIIHSQNSSQLNDTMTSALSSSSGLMSPSQSSPPLPKNQSSSNRVVNWPDDDEVYIAAAPPPPSRIANETARVDDAADQFLMANIEATIGPRGSAPDIESLSGRSYKSPRLRQQTSDAKSIDSRTSRNSRYSFRTYESNRSALKGIKSMSPESKSVANDLFRLEAQLAEVARQQELQGDEPLSSPREVIFVGDSNTLNKNNSSNSDMSSNNGYIGAEPAPRLNPITVVAPPGKLGILLSNNKAGGVSPTPTHVSAVRSESVLAGKVQVGDQLMKIDGEDVSRCNSKQIMAIMAGKSELERVLEFRCLESSYDPLEWI